MTSSILSDNVISGVIKGYRLGAVPSTDRLVYDFDGTTMFAIMGQTWEPLGVPYTVSFQYITDDAINSAFILGNSDGDSNPASALVFGGVTWAYVDVAGANRSAIAGTSLSADTIYTVSITADGVDVRGSVDGVDGAVMAFASKSVGMGELKFIGSGDSPILQPFGGSIWNLRLADDSPLHGRTVMPGDGARYVTLNNTITLPSTDLWTIEFDFIRYDNNQTTHADSNQLFSSSDAATILTITDTTNAAPDRVSLNNVGTNISFSNALADVVEGQHCRVRIERGSTNVVCYVDDVQTGTQVVTGIGDIVIDRLYRASNAAFYMDSGAVMGDLEITNVTTGDTWFYALKDES